MLLFTVKVEKCNKPCPHHLSCLVDTNAGVHIQLASGQWSPPYPIFWHFEFFKKYIKRSFLLFIFLYFFIQSICSELVAWDTHLEYFPAHLESPTHTPCYYCTSWYVTEPLFHPIPEAGSFPGGGWEAGAGLLSGGGAGSREQVLHHRHHPQTPVPVCW